MSAAAATVLFVAAITPGPNNFVVMDVARRARPTSVAAPIGGIISGTLALVVGVWLGIDTLLDRWPAGEIVLRVIGAGLLCYLAFRTVAAGWSNGAESNALPQRQGHLFPVMLVLQIVNPKTWVLAITVVAAHCNAPLLTLLLLVVAVPATCLVIWAAAGRALAPILARPETRKIFATIVGSALLVFAIFVLIRGA